VVPSKIQHFTYNSKNDETHKSDLPSSVPGSNPYMQHALEVSDSLYQQPVIQPVATRVEDKQQLDEYAKKQKGVYAAGTVQLQAEGDYPKVKLGNQVLVKIIQKEIKGDDTPEHGEYIVISITHRLSGTGEYMHTFEAIPSDNNYIPATVPPVNAETQMAVVKDNKDPDGMGRVRVEMLWQQSTGQMTDWIRVLTPDAGKSDSVSKNRGFVFVPEVGDQVLVGFRYNDPNRPFVMGSIFHGKTAGGGGTGNNTKSLTTRSGSTVILDDSKKNITISDPSGNKMVYDGSGNVNVTSPKTMTLSCGSSSITLNQDGTIQISGKNITVNGSTKSEMTSGAASFTTDAAGGKADMKGTTSTVTGTKTAVVTAPDTTINGDAKAGITSSGPTSIEGCIVKLN
ncbi:MAG TPA: phage baseplate assembly protein V, partial [Bacteroidia bacterium]|nr:phage baseplate assembly protein V [Bacteroidia bacterium]